MEKELFLKLFHKSELALPIRSSDRDVYIILKKLFDDYKTLLDQYNSDIIQIEKIQSNCNYILKAIENYYLGDPVSAYNEIQRLMNMLNNRNRLILYKKNEYASRFNTNNDPLNLYRIRPISEERTYSRKEIFHVPFSLRRYVSTSRFSIAGYPSLYLGTSPDLSRIETGLKKGDKYIVSKFKVIRDLNDTQTKVYVLDLAIKPNEIEKFVESSGFYSVNDQSFRKSYIEAYPIIAACSIMVEKKDKNFYPEYIVPQLLMQWLSKKDKQDNNAIYGIRYFTCRSKNPRIEVLNYVFPVSSCNVENSEDDYCSVLRDAFLLTEPIISTRESFENRLENGILEKIYC